MTKLPAPAPRESLEPAKPRPSASTTPLPMAAACKGDCPDCPNRRPAEETAR